MPHTILIFIDGLGWGDSVPQLNPCLAYGGELFHLPERPDLGDVVPVFGGGFATPIDAVLGVPGIPQSATGQTTLLTGVNAQAVLGKHLTGFPNPALREILRAHSLLKAVKALGCRARFLNAFRPLFWELSEAGQWKLSATTVANLAAGLPFFSLEDLCAGRAVYQEFTNRELQDRGFAVPARTPAAAGEILAEQARNFDFLLFEYFQTDKAGHSGEEGWCKQELAKLDEFVGAVLGGLAAELASETLVVLTSDHGNLEDLTTRHHTENPLPLMVWGAGAEGFLQGVTRLDQVAPKILDRHGRGQG